MTVVLMFSICAWTFSVPPQPLQRAGQRLLQHARVDMAGALAESETIVVALGRQRRGHAAIGERPVVPALFRVVVMQVELADLHPDADRLARRRRNERRVILP